MNVRNQEGPGNRGGGIGFVRRRLQLQLESRGALASSFSSCYNFAGMRIEALRSVPLFRNLDDHAAFELCNLLTVREVAGGKPLFFRGDAGDAMYLIESGRVRISVKDADGHDATLT